MKEIIERIGRMSAVKLAQASRKLVAERHLLQAEPLAILGIGCRFPGGADTPERYWQLIHDGIDTIDLVPDERWNWQSYYSEDGNTPGLMNYNAGAFIDRVGEFEPRFFGISRKEALSMDPQQQMLLELCWEAMEHANIVPRELFGKRVGVFMGISSAEAFLRASSSPDLVSRIDAWHGTGLHASAATGRIAYSFGFRGPCMSIDTACSSSLVALHQACNSLRRRESDAALVGGVNLIMSPIFTLALNKANMSSPDGRCKTFDASADGYGRGEGGGVIMIKRLSDALSDGDPVLAVIRGSAINQDGRSSGLTVPNGPSQQSVIRQALEDGGVAPEKVDYVEAHGTGTALGDPIEIGALNAVFGSGRDRPLLVGSVKTNINHLESAAGIAGVIKTVLALQHNEIPPHIHFTDPSPHIPWDQINIEIPTSPRPWSDRGGDRRVAGVSSFGFSGTNVHVVIESAPQSRKASPAALAADTTVPLMLYARSEASLKQMALQYAEYLDSSPQEPLQRIARTAFESRTRFDQRLAVISMNCRDMAKQLRAFAQGKADSGVVRGAVNPERRVPTVAFLFTGQGAQFAAMGEALYHSNACFRSTLDQCNEILSPLLERPLLSVLYGSKEDQQLLHQTAYTQPAIFSVGCALVEVWRTSCGVQPSVVMGHSVGEYVAAWAAGVYSLEDGLRLIAERARLMQALPADGGMLATDAPREQMDEVMLQAGETVSLAAENGPNNHVLSGSIASLQRVAELLKSRGSRATMLQVSHAFHSRLLEPMLDPLCSFCDALEFSPAKVDLVGNLTAELVAEIDGQYWRQHARQPVLFARGVEQLDAMGVDAFIEIGPGSTLLNMARRLFDRKEAATRLWLPSLQQGESENLLLSSLLKLHLHGLDINADMLWEETVSDREIRLPTYPFNRQLCWNAEAGERLNRAQEMPISGNRAVTEQQPNDHKATAAVIEENYDMNRIDNPGDRKDEVLAVLTARIAEEWQEPVSEIDVHSSLLEVGADSFMLMMLQQFIEQEFAVEVVFRRFFEDLDTLTRIAASVAEALPDDWAPPASLASTGTEVVAQEIVETTAKPELHETSTTVADGVERVVQEQLKIMQQQLELMRGGVTPPAPAASSRPEVEAEPQKMTGMDSSRSAWEKNSRDLDPDQQQFLDSLFERYLERTGSSRDQAQRTRPYWCDNRVLMNMRPETREICYPIVSDQAQGGHIRDLDGNDYVDLACGLGVHLFGHQVPFIDQAIQELISSGWQVGSQTSVGDEAAELLCELTGAERVTFCSTGTEAVMSAIRIARAVRERDKIVFFSGAYHGHSDATLVVSARSKGEFISIPMTPGVPQHVADQALVLEYGSEKSLKYLRSHMDEFAAVIVEPVQSRNPSLQPVEFLRELREMTREHDVPLIFDEMITGFRIAPGGAQQWFGVEADMVTYGKALGGGMPLSAVAGKARYLDHIDGGQWYYEEEGSFPPVETSFAAAGTFRKHPLALVCGLAVLRHLKQQGPQLQQQLNLRTEEMAERINRIFAEVGVPFEVVTFGSLFRFVQKGNFSYLYQPLEMDLFVYSMILEGVYIWEGRTCFLSTAHTDSDLEQVVEAAGRCARLLKEGGFFDSSVSLSGAELTEHSNVADSALPGVTGEAPLTHAQSQLWAMSQISTGAALSNLMFTDLELHGPIELERLQDALQVLMLRHEALRTTFSVDGERQIISPHLQNDIDHRDLSSISSEQQEEAFREIRHQGNQTPIPLDASALRLTLVSLNARHHHLIMATNHILIDGGSNATILEELFSLYSAACKGETVHLEDPKQFSDYRLWREEMDQSSDKVRQQGEWWLQQFAGEIPLLQLPGDSPQSAQRNYQASRREIVLDAALYQQIKVQAKQCGVTPFLMTLSAYMLLLHRLSGQQEVISGFLVPGRPVGYERMVGYCVHILPLISKVDSEITVRDYLRQMLSAFLDAKDHQDYTYSRLIDQLNSRRNKLNAPLISTIFNMDMPVQLPDIWQLKSDWHSHPIEALDNDLSINLTDIDGQLLVEFDYSSERFSDQTIERWLGYYRMMLEEISRSVEQSATCLPMLNERELGEIVAWGHGEEVADIEKSVVECFEEQVNHASDEAAIFFVESGGGRGTVSWKQLNHQANQLAHTLVEHHHVGRGSLIGISIDRSAEMVAALLGILKTGAAYVPMDPAYPDERIEEMYRQSGAELVLTQSSLQQRWEGMGVKTVLVDGWGAFAEASTENLPSKPAADDIAYVIFTSGSTGKPKGVVIEHRSLFNLLADFKARTDFGKGKRLLSVTTLSFDIAGLEIFLPLISGGELLLPDSEISHDGGKLRSLLEEQPVDLMQATPATWQMLLTSGWKGDAERTGGGQGMTLLCGGEALKRPLAEALLSRCGRLLNVYGPTETTIWSTVHDVTANPDQPQRIGYPLKNTNLYILDRNGQLVPPGVSGEIYIGGAGLAQGYWQQKGLTAERFIEAVIAGRSQRLYRSGDLAAWAEDGSVEYRGRTDHQIKLRGYRIELGEIEAVLAHQPGVQESVVTLYEEGNEEDNEGDSNPRLVACVVSRHPLQEGAEQQEWIEQLRDGLRKCLPDYMVPALFLLLETMPLTPNGKLDRKRLPQPSSANDENLVKAETETEQALTTIWQELLKLETVGVTHSFFEVGGHSLLGMQLVMRIKQSFSIEITLTELFRSPTIRQLSEIIDTHIWARDGLSSPKDGELLAEDEIELEV